MTRELGKKKDSLSVMTRGKMDKMAKYERVRLGCKKIKDGLLSIFLKFQRPSHQVRVEVIKGRE